MSRWPQTVRTAGIAQCSPRPLARLTPAPIAGDSAEEQENIPPALLPRDTTWTFNSGHKATLSSSGQLSRARNGAPHAVVIGQRSVVLRNGWRGTTTWMGKTVQWSVCVPDGTVSLTGCKPFKMIADHEGASGPGSASLSGSGSGSVSASASASASASVSASASASASASVSVSASALVQCPLRQRQCPRLMF